MSEQLINRKTAVVDMFPDGILVKPNRSHYIRNYSVRVFSHTCVILDGLCPQKTGVIVDLMPPLWAFLEAHVKELCKMQIKFAVISEGNKVTLLHKNATHLIHIHTIFFKIHNTVHWPAPSPGTAYSNRSLLGVVCL